MYIVQSTWIFVVTVCSSVMCREIAVPCSMRTHYKECISNESCSWCCDPAVMSPKKAESISLDHIHGFLKPLYIWTQGHNKFPELEDAALKRKVRGEVCRCEETSVRERSVQAGCRPDNSSTVDCSGRGAYVCGRCECELRENPNEEILGTFCECDNFSCARWNGLLCGGAERGRCVCGECVCYEDWSGLSNQTCVSHYSDTW